MGGPRPVQASPAETIQERIWTAIAEHRLRPGMRLKEEQLSEIFAVSRTRVRSALAALERDGLVTLVPNRGAFVAEPTIEDARDVFFARSTIEGRLVERLCATVRPEDIARLEAHIVEERSARAGGDVSSAIRLSGAFHILLAELAGSRSLFQVLRDLVSRTSLITAMYHPQSRTDCGPDEHMEIVHLIAGGEVEAAKRAMETHLAHIEGRLVLEEEPEAPKDLRAILG
jgi:DNA-binding GntR family transcriptional regulator